MALPPPSTVSPGKLVLEYTHNGFLHQVGFNMLAGEDTGDLTQWLTEAQALADILAPVMPPSATFQNYKITNRTGDPLYEGPITTPRVGTASTTGPNWNSNTMTYTGHGVGNPIGHKAGSTKMMLFVGDALQPTPGQKTAPVPGSGQYHAVANYLFSNGHIWADVYGQKATVHPQIAIQFNAHAQDTLGS